LTKRFISYRERVSALQREGDIRRERETERFRHRERDRDREREREWDASRSASRCRMLTKRFISLLLLDPVDRPCLRV